MKRLLYRIKKHLKLFFINPLWKSWPNLIILLVSMAINGYIWYAYLKNFKQIVGITPIIFGSAVILLNLFLSAIVFRKEPLMGYILIGSSFTIQILIIAFLELSTLSNAF